MAAGLIQYVLTRKNLPESVHEVTVPFTPRQNGILSRCSGRYSSHNIPAGHDGLDDYRQPRHVVVSAVGIGAIALFIQLLTAKNVTNTERSRVWAFIPLWIANAIFWALYQQQFTVIPIYSDERLDWHILGMDLPPTLVNSLAPIFVILLGAGFAAMWTKLGDRQPRTTTKFSLALVIIGPAYWVFLTQVGVSRVAVYWMVIIMFIFTVAELTISPTGMALTTRLAPEAYKVNMMALYWTSLAMGTASRVGAHSSTAKTPRFPTSPMWVPSRLLLVLSSSSARTRAETHARSELERPFCCRNIHWWVYCHSNVAIHPPRMTSRGGHAARHAPRMRQAHR